jgi:DHA2 family multidrug resistance protein-like MFS transporter
VLSIAAILTAIYGLKQSVQDGVSWLSLAAMLVGVALAVVFLRRQGRLADPMVDLSLFRDRAFNVSLGSNVLNVFVSFGSFILISQYLQLVLGLSPLMAGLLSLPASALAIVGPMLSPLLSERLGMRQALSGLLAITAVGFAVQAFVSGPLAVVTVALGWALWAFGGSAAATLTTGTVIASARPERAGAVSALAQAGAELGGALGIAVLGSLGTAIYRSGVAGAIPSEVSPELAAAARDTLGGALNVAGQLSDPAAAATLVATAQQSMTTAVQATCALSAVLSLVAAVAVAVYFEARNCKEEAPVDRCEREAMLMA